MQRSFEAFTPLSAQDFLAFGLNDIAYVRSVEGPEDKQVGIFAADGTQMATVPSRELAFAAIRQHEMEPLSVH